MSKDYADNAILISTSKVIYTTAVLSQVNSAAREIGLLNCAFLLYDSTFFTRWYLPHAGTTESIVECPTKFLGKFSDVSVHSIAGKSMINRFTTPYILTYKVDIMC